MTDYQDDPSQPANTPADLPDLPMDAAIDVESAADIDDTNAYADSDGEQSDVEPANAPDAGLEAADTNADSDLARPRRGGGQKNRRQPSRGLAWLGPLLIALGGLWLFESLTPGSLPTWLLTSAPALLLAIALVGRFFLNGRRERGLFVLGFTLLLLLGVAYFVQNGTLSLGLAAGFGILLLGFALLITFIFERNHEPGLVLLAMMAVAAGAAALLVSSGLLPAEITNLFADFWPLLLWAAALLLLPSAFRLRGGN
jgi:hypothetical protein